MTQPTSEHPPPPAPALPDPPADDVARRPRWRRATEAALDGATAGVPF